MVHIKLLYNDQIFLKPICNVSVNGCNRNNYLYFFQVTASPVLRKNSPEFCPVNALYKYFASIQCIEPKHFILAREALQKYLQYFVLIPPQSLWCGKYLFKRTLLQLQSTSICCFNLQKLTLCLLEGNKKSLMKPFKFSTSLQ